MKGQDPFLTPPDFLADARTRAGRWASDAAARAIGAKPPRQSRLSDRTLTLAALWLITAGVLLLLLSGGIWLYELHALASRQVTTGTITEYVPREDAAGHVLFYPHIRFRTPDGTIEQFLGPDGTNPAPFTAGGHVSVIYPSGHPEAARMTHRSPRHPVSQVLAVIGIALFDLGGFFWIAHYLRRRKAHRAGSPS